MLKNEFITYMEKCHTMTQLTMFRVMGRSIAADDVKAAWKFYLNDLDKLGSSDRSIRQTVEDYFRPLGFICTIPIR